MRYENDRKRCKCDKCSLCGKQLKPKDVRLLDHEIVCAKCYDETKDELDDGSN